MINRLGKKHVLITVPDLNKSGGVSSLYNILKFDTVDRVQYFGIHGDNNRKGLPRIFELVRNYFRFAQKLDRVSLVQVNPSLDKKSFLRDGLFSFIAKTIKRKQTVVYWHGWKEPFEQRIHKSQVKRFFFKNTFGKADMHIVLGGIFEQKLAGLGIDKNRIRRESNAADNSFLANRFHTSIPGKPATLNILYLARIEESKGIFVAIDTIKAIGGIVPVKLIVAGNGSDEGRAMAYAETSGVGNIEFVGYVDGASKDEILSKSHVLLLPSYSEGMPISILEGMLYGLPVVSRPIGGIPDWVIDGENGFLVKSLNPLDFSEAIITLAKNECLLKSMSQRNIDKANAHFTPESVRSRLLEYYDTLICS